MTLQKLFDIAARRTPGEWPNYWGVDIRDQITVDGVVRPAIPPDDAQFIATVANCWPEIESVLEAAHRVCFDVKGDLIKQERILKGCVELIETKLAGMEVDK